MQRNQRISSRSVIPTRERLASRERGYTWQNLGDEARLTITAIILRKPLDFRGHPARVSSLRSCKREEQQRQERRVAPRPHRRPFSRDIKITVAPSLKFR